MSQTLSSADRARFGCNEPLAPSAGDNAYFLELDRLLARIETATSYYQALGVARDLSREQLDQAFSEILSILYPRYQLSATLPAEMLTRIERAFNKAAQGFSVLASFTRRREYDAALMSGAAPAATAATSPATAPAASQPPPSPALHLHQKAEPRAAYVEFAKRAGGGAHDNRRRTDRIRLSLPVRIVGVDQGVAGKWSEIAETLDVSRTGLRLRLNRAVRYGMVLYLSLPLPAKLRSHGFMDSSYNVYALVRRIEPLKKGMRTVGLEFIGEHPPAGYLETPWATFRTRRWAGDDRRRARRIPRAEPVRLEYIIADRPTPLHEEAMTENVSRTGLRVIVRTAPPEFDLLRVISTAHYFEDLAVLRNRFHGEDGLERLCVQFLNKDWPL
ncbi:MAG TPA: PilZ domain-containing protein [Blastocatellia bacterium]|nr:PilZ domain-containing protein [Blastocatellia bacterium]